MSNGAGRAQPDHNKSFIDTGKTPTLSNPTVFESLYHRTEAFPYYVVANTTANVNAGANVQNSTNPNLIAKPPSPIGNTPTYYTYYVDESTKANVPYTVNGQYVNLDETNEIGQNYLYFRNSNNPNFPVLYMAKVNTPETRYVWDVPFKPSDTRSIVFPNNVLEVKSAWRRVRDIKNSNPADYHQAPATYYTAGADGVPHAVTEQFAMIALHIIQKTANYQSFIFTTFEHVDAVTRNQQNYITDPAFQLAYNQLTYDSGNTQSYSANANGAYYINEPNLPPANNQLATYRLPNAGAAPNNIWDGGYTTVIQPKTITKEVNDVNNDVYSKIKASDSNNIWANYRLKGVQANPTSDQNTFDYYLANIVVESSQPGVQLFRGGVSGPTQSGNTYTFGNERNDGSLSANISENLVYGQAVPAAKYTMGGCQGCHGRAQQTGRDFSFLASGVLGNGKEVDSVPSSALSAAAVAAHNKAMAKSSAYDQ